MNKFKRVTRENKWRLTSNEWKTLLPQKSGEGKNFACHFTDKLCKNAVLWSAVTMTPLGTDIIVTVTDCRSICRHIINLETTWVVQKLSVKPIVTLTLAFALVEQLMSALLIDRAETQVIKQ